MIFTSEDVLASLFTVNFMEKYVRSVNHLVICPTEKTDYAEAVNFLKYLQYLLLRDILKTLQ